MICNDFHKLCLPYISKSEFEHLYKMTCLKIQIYQGGKYRFLFGKLRVIIISMIHFNSLVGFLVIFVMVFWEFFRTRGFLSPARGVGPGISGELDPRKLPRHPWYIVLVISFDHHMLQSWILVRNTCLIGQPDRLLELVWAGGGFQDICSYFMDLNVDLFYEF